MKREYDHSGLDFASLRSGKIIPTGQYVLEPGNIVIPEENVAITAVVASSVLVTFYDPDLKRGGMSHFIRAISPEKEKPTPRYGLPACVALLRQFENLGSKSGRLFIGLYGGAIPEWANATQRDIARSNLEVVRDVMQKKGIPIADEDTGGIRGRRIMFLTGTNEIAILKTDRIRKSDWFPEFKEAGPS